MAGWFAIEILLYCDQMFLRFLEIRRTSIFRTGADSHCDFFPSMLFPCHSMPGDYGFDPLGKFFLISHAVSCFEGKRREYVKFGLVFIRFQYWFF